MFVQGRGWNFGSGDLLKLLSPEVVWDAWGFVLKAIEQGMGGC
jgi:hypothetical protein